MLPAALGLLSHLIGLLHSPLLVGVRNEEQRWDRVRPQDESLADLREIGQLEVNRAQDGAVVRLEAVSPPARNGHRPFLPEGFVLGETEEPDVERRFPEFRAVPVEAIPGAAASNHLDPENNFGLLLVT
jgi:hypothetical protein